MKTLNEMTAEELAALKPGDQVQARADRSPDFRFVVADAAIVLLALPNTVVISFTRTDPREITLNAVVVPPMGGGFSINPSTISVLPGTLEEAQVRMSPDISADLGISLLTHLLSAAPEMARGKINANPALRLAILGNEPPQTA